jgi:hypothetical protein
MEATSDPQDPAERMQAAFEGEIEASKPRFAALIHEVTGWHGVDNLASWMVDLLTVNSGRDGDENVRPPCWQEHAPMTVDAFTDVLVAASNLPADDPGIQRQVDEYRRRLRERFGL